MCTIKCRACGGLKSTKTSVFVPVQKGIHSNNLLQVKDYGNFMPDNTTRGDLYVKVLIVDPEDTCYKRKGNDLYTTIDLSLKEALLGIKNTKTTRKHLDGRPLVINYTLGDIITPDTKITQPNQGMPIFNDPDNTRGDLIISFNIVFPTSINIPESKYDKNVITLLFETKEEKEAREKTIIIDDDDDNDDNFVDKDNHHNASDICDDVYEYYSPWEQNNNNESISSSQSNTTTLDDNLRNSNTKNSRKKSLELDHGDVDSLHDEYLKVGADLERLKSQLKRMRTN